MIINGYRCMWVLAMFDLPTDTKKARKAYARFRKSLLEDGFTMMQFSVYARHCPSKENADVHTQRIRGNLPSDGEVRILTITDKQFERMQIFWGKKRKQPEPAPSQLQLF
jgi:CRISPR-associated protein Cas2